MEIADMGAFFKGEWESLSNVYTFDDELEFGTHKLLSHPTDSTFVAPFIDNEYFYDNNLFCNSHINNFSFENNHFSLPNDEVYPMNLNMIDQGINHASTTASPLGSVEDNESYILASTHDMKVKVKRKKNGQELLDAEEMIEVVAKKKTKNGNRRIESTENKEDDESNVGVGNKSDEESMASIGKKRASRGTATDPQSLYARRRREKINERLKILQNLVPNGTKVDISTMLEEAVQYVKFLQLQIRLLSSDDLWMYAPLAYNGVDINLYQRISPFLIP